MTTSTISAKPLRRVPVQGRSVARVQRMLDACAELIDEVGYDGLSTTLLAERAGVAIGSVYQFFPDKRAIVQALSLRNVEAYLARLGERIPASELWHWVDGVDAAVDEYIELHRTVPGFRYDRDFGGVFYLFLRGMTPAAGATRGVFFDRPPAARIEALSDLLRGGPME